MSSRLACIITTFAAIFCASDSSAQMKTCESQYLLQVDPDLPDFIDVGPDQDFIDAVESAYGCSVSAETIISLKGVKIALGSGEWLGQIDEVSVDLEGTIAYAKVGVDEFLGFGDEKILVPLDEIFVSSDGRSVANFTTVDHFIPSSSNEIAVMDAFADDFRSAVWLDSVLRLILPPKRVPLEIMSEPSEATILLKNRPVGITKRRSLIRESIIEDLALEKRGFETCRFADATFVPRATSNYATLSCVLLLAP